MAYRIIHPQGGMYGRAGVPKKYFIVFIAIAFIGAIAINKLNDNSYYLLYPKLTYQFTLATVILTSVTTVGLIFIYRKLRVRLQRRLIYYSLFLLVCLVNIACLIGGLQFLLYLAEKESFIVDDQVKNYEIKIERETLERIRTEITENLRLSRTAVRTIQSEPLTISRRRQTGSFWRKNRNLSEYQLKGKSSEILLQRIWNGIPEDPMKPYPTHTAVYEYAIVISALKSEFTFSVKGNQELILARYFQQPYQIDRSSLIRALKSKAAEQSSNIKTLTDNIALIEDRGIPLRQFVYDSFMKILQQDPEIFKALSWKSRLLSGLSLFLTVLILMPFITDVFERWRNRVAP